MNDFERRKCLELTNKMLHMDLCKPFKDRVDPIRDGAPNYNDIVKHPMDLSTIRKNLNGNEHRQIEDWAASVNLVWSNAMLFNSEGTLLHLIAKEMEMWFKRKYESTPRNRDEEWMMMLGKSTKKMVYLSQHPPASIVPIKATQNSEGDDDRQPRGERAHKSKTAETRRSPRGGVEEEEEEDS